MAKRVLQFTKPPKDAEAIQVGLMNDTYKADSIKGGTRKECGDSGVTVKIDGFDQRILQGSQWQEFFKQWTE